MKPQTMICPKAKTCKYRCDSMCLGHDKPHKINIDCSESTCSKCVPYKAATKPPKTPKWKPEVLGVYYAINTAFGQVYKLIFTPKDITCITHIKNGNYFRTKSEAQAMLNKIIKLMRGNKNER